MSKRPGTAPRSTPPPRKNDLRELREAADEQHVLGRDYDSLGEETLKSLVEQRPAAGSGVAPLGALTSDGDSDPRDQESWTFQFDWTDSRGKRFAGRFTNRILTLGLLQRVAAAQAAMQQGQPVESFSPAMLVINNAISHMIFSLTERPAWAKDLTALTSVELVMKLWEKVRSHEDRYFRAETTPDSSDEAEEQ
jgi:hypothetical protein